MNRSAKIQQASGLFASRSAPVSLGDDGRPASIDEATRSIEVVASTEAPALVWDWSRFELVNEVLLMSGCRIPPGNKCVFLDTHNRESVSRVLGSFRQAQVRREGGEAKLVGRPHFSRSARQAWEDTCDGHITDVSVGYEIHAYAIVKEDETSEIEGRSFTGPMRVVTDWSLKEVSLCAIGADDAAKFRNLSGPEAAGQDKENPMKKKQKAASTPGSREEAQKPAGESTSEFNLDEEGNPIATEEPAHAPGEVDREDPDDDDEETRADGEESDEEGEEEKAERKGKRASSSKTPVIRAARLERERVLGIQNMCRSFAVPQSLEHQLIASGVSLGSAREKVMGMLEARNAGVTASGPGFRVETGRTEMQRAYQAAQHGLFMRCSVAVEAPAPGSDNFQGMSMREMARELLRLSGCRSIPVDSRELFARALTTTDLPQLLVETSRRSLLQAYERNEETWGEWCATGRVDDFKVNKAVGLEPDFKLRELPESAEYERGNLGEVAEEYKIATFGEMLTISRQALINDDLGALTAIPEGYGEACSRLIGDIAYACLTSNPKMADGERLFSTKHKNLYTGKGGLPTVPNLGAVRSGMKAQTDSKGNKRPIRPVFFLAPTGMETECDVFFNTQIASVGPVTSTQANPVAHNPFGGTYFQRVHEYRLDDADADAWYLAGHKGSTVTVFFLNGVMTPYMETQNGWNTDGVEMKVRMDAGAKALRSITLAKATK